MGEPISAGAGTIIGSIISAIGSAASTAMSNSAGSSIASKSAKKSFLYTKALDKYRATELSRMSFDQNMENLKRWGINRALAFGNLSDGYQGSGQFSVPTPDVKSPDFSHSASLISKAMEQKIAEAQLKRQELMDSFSAKSLMHGMDIQDQKLEIDKELADAEISLKRQKAITESHMPDKIKQEIQESLSRKAKLDADLGMYESAKRLNEARIKNLDETTRLMPEAIRKFGSWAGVPGFGRVTLSDLVNLGHYFSEWLRSPSGHSASEVEKRSVKRKIFIDAMRHNDMMNK